MQAPGSEVEAQDEAQAARRLHRRLRVVVAAASLALLAFYSLSTLSFHHSIVQPVPGAYVAPSGHAAPAAPHPRGQP